MPQQTSAAAFDRQTARAEAASMRSTGWPDARAVFMYDWDPDAPDFVVGRWYVKVGGKRGTTPKYLRTDGYVN
jgi:hypothetical protein